MTLRNICLLPAVVAITASLSFAQTGSITRIEENNPSIAYSGNWYTNTGAGNSGGSAALTNATGARAVVTFTGRGISWIGVGDQWNGLATVNVDGQPYKVDGYAPTTRYQMVLFTVNGLALGPHKLSIEVNHDRGPNAEGSWVWIDAFDIEDGAGVAGGLAAASVGRVENDNPAVTYAGNWYSNVHSMHSGGSAVLASGNGDSVSIKFNGTGIAWIAYRDEWSGLARVFVDNQLKATIDTYLLPGQARMTAYTIDDLPPGEHSLRIEVTGTNNPSSGGSWVWLDAFDVMQSAAIPAQTPVLSLNAAKYCIGSRWVMEVSNAAPNATVVLRGTTNGEPWTIPGWATTDANGELKRSGSYGEGSQGSYTLAVEIDGKVSNTVPIQISAECRVDILP